MKAYTRFWIMGSLAAAILLLGIPFVGCMLVIGDRLSAVHPWLAWMFYAAAPLGLLAPPAYWLARILRAPRWRPLAKKLAEKRRSPWNDRWQEDLSWRDSAIPDERLMDLAAFHVRHSPTLADTEDAEEERRMLADLARMARDGGAWPDFRRALVRLRELREKHAHACIRKYTRRVFLSTSISQKGVADAWITLVLNMKMAQEVVRLYGMRPSLWNVCKLVRATCAVSFLSYSAEDVLADKVLAAPLETAANVPLVGWLLKPLVSSCINGCLNGVLTMRVGYVVESLITEGLPENEDECKDRRRKIMKLVAHDFYRTVKEPVDRLKEAVISRAREAGHHMTEQIRESVSSAFRQCMESMFPFLYRKKGKTVPQNGQVKPEEAYLHTEPEQPKRKWPFSLWPGRKGSPSPHENP